MRTSDYWCLGSPAGAFIQGIDPLNARKRDVDPPERKTMRIFLANPPWPRPGSFAVRAGSRWPHFEQCDVDYQPFPFFLAIATTLLKNDGFDARLRDSLALRESIDEFLESISNCAPEIVFFEISTPSLENDLKIAEKTLDQFRKRPLMIFGGLHKPENVGELFMSFPGLSVFIHGEYETILLEVARAIRAGQPDFSRISGISFRADDGAIKTTATRPPLDNLNLLPRPAYDQLPMERFYDACGGLPKPSVQLWASRGCPYGCIFCAWPQLMFGGRNYRVRDSVLVADELEWLVSRYGFRSAYFDDDTFNIGKERIIGLSKEIARRNLQIEWGAMARADTMDRETLECMVQSGLRAIKYGVESGNQAILDDSGKRLDLAKVRETVRWTRELGIKFHLSFAFGLPGETWQTVKQTVNLALELDPTSIQFSLVTPFPGSDYYRILKEKNLLTDDDWSKFDGYTTSVIKTEALSSADLEKALRFAESRWRRHLAIRIIRSEGFGVLSRAIRHPRQLLNFMRSLVNG
jgi:anaerobic magnesium-protoporphyrin IX monomethyl ester cyclase